MENVYKNYIEDIMECLIDSYSTIQLNDQDDFNRGRAIGYAEVLSFLNNQLDVFDIKKDLKEKNKVFVSPL